MNVIFNYISGGKTLNRYIKSRKMMATYKMMIADKEYDVQSDSGRSTAYIFNGV